MVPNSWKFDLWSRLAPLGHPLGAKMTQEWHQEQKLTKIHQFVGGPWGPKWSPNRSSNHEKAILVVTWGLSGGTLGPKRRPNEKNDAQMDFQWTFTSPPPNWDSIFCTFYQNRLKTIPERFSS